jgi:hypothetical protein
LKVPSGTEDAGPHRSMSPASGRIGGARRAERAHRRGMAEVSYCGMIVGVPTRAQSFTICVSASAAMLRFSQHAVQNIHTGLHKCVMRIRAAVSVRSTSVQRLVRIETGRLVALRCGHIATRKSVGPKTFVLPNRDSAAGLQGWSDLPVSQRTLD